MEQTQPRRNGTTKSSRSQSTDPGARSKGSIKAAISGHVVVVCTQSRVGVELIGTDPKLIHWETTESTSASSLPPSLSQHYTPVVYPPATLDAASRRISLLYQGMIFGDTGDEEEQVDVEPEYNETSQLIGVRAVSSV